MVSLSSRPQTLHDVVLNSLTCTGMNYSAQPLQLHEIASMKADNVVMDRFMRSYRMMLDFYGMQLLDERTGLICRSDRYERRYRNLSRQ